jgi:hypothetical protein
MIRRFDRPRMIIVTSLDDVPDFGSEAEEAEYWDTHELGGEALEKMGPLDDILGPPDQRPSP